MSKINTFETDLLELIFNNTDLANIGDAAGLQNSATEGELFVSLWVGDPTDTGSGGTEAAYTGYGREGVARSAAGWTVANGVASNTAKITFGACTASSSTVTHFGIHTAVTAGSFLYSGALTAELAITAGITPEIAIGALTVTED